MVFNGGTFALIVSLAAGLIYGLGFAGKPPSALRTIVKMMAVGSLALFGLYMWLGDASAVQPAALLGQSQVTGRRQPGRRLDHSGQHRRLGEC